MNSCPYRNIVYKKVKQTWRQIQVEDYKANNLSSRHLKPISGFLFYHTDTLCLINVTAATSLRGNASAPTRQTQLKKKRDDIDLISVLYNLVFSVLGLATQPGKTLRKEWNTGKSPGYLAGMRRVKGTLLFCVNLSRFSVLQNQAMLLVPSPHSA